MAGVSRRGVSARRLEAGHTYFDMNQPERGPFVATGDEWVDANADIVDRQDVSEDAWQRLVSEGWGENPPGSGDRSYDQGAFGQERDPRNDVINAAPPGVGEGLTPKEGEEELRRR